jgi:hypothetical protein
MRRYISALLVAACLIALAGCTTEKPSGAITPATEYFPELQSITPPSDNTGHPASPSQSSASTPAYPFDLLNEDETLTHATEIYKAFFALKIKYEGQGGIKPLPEEFNQYLMENALAGIEELMAYSYENEFEYRGELWGQVDVIRPYREFIPGTKFAIEVCQSSGGAEVRAQGVLLTTGAKSTTYSKVYFKFDEEMNFKIFDAEQKGVEACPIA